VNADLKEFLWVAGAVWGSLILLGFGMKAFDFFLGWIRRKN